MEKFCSKKQLKVNEKRKTRANIGNNRITLKIKKKADKTRNEQKKCSTQSVMSSVWFIVLFIN
jgi:hypothetical protein